MGHPPPPEVDNGGIDVNLAELEVISSGLNTMGNKCKDVSSRLSRSRDKINFLRMSSAGESTIQSADNAIKLTGDAGEKYNNISTKVREINIAYQTAENNAEQQINIAGKFLLDTLEVWNSPENKKDSSGNTASKIRINTEIILLTGKKYYGEFTKNPQKARLILKEDLMKHGYSEEEAEKYSRGFEQGFRNNKIYDQETKIINNDNLSDTPPSTIKEYEDNLQKSVEIHIDKERESGDPNTRGYSQIVVKTYDDGNGNRKVYAYIPGTDFFDGPNVYGKPGEPFNAAGAAGIGRINPDTPLADSKSMQMLDKALKEAGVTSEDELHLVGHSQGAAIAYNAANNNEFSKEYNVQHVVSFGGPIQNLPARDDNKKFRVTQVRNEDDPVPNIMENKQGQWEPRPEDSTFIMPDNFSDPGGETYGFALAHDLSLYSKNLSKNPDVANYTVSQHKGNYKAKDATAYSATAMPDHIVNSDERHGYQVGDAEREAGGTLANGGNINLKTLGLYTLDSFQEMSNNSSAKTTDETSAPANTSFEITPEAQPPAKSQMGSSPMSGEIPNTAYSYEKHSVPEHRPRPEPAPKAPTIEKQPPIQAPKGGSAPVVRGGVPNNFSRAGGPPPM